MKKRIQRLYMGLIAVLLAAPGLSEGTAVQRSTAAERSDLAVTVYNEDLALVRDVRRLQLPVGESALRFEEVSRRIRPHTVSLRSLSAPHSMLIHEQNYLNDLVHRHRLMELYVGKELQLRNRHRDLGFDTVDATLLSTISGPIYQIGQDVYLDHPGQVVLPEMPADLVAQPTLEWMLETTQPEQEIEVSYLTRGMRWQADYVMRLYPDSDTFSLTGWITLDNQSGLSYPQAELKLVAGEVNIIRDDPMFGLMGAMGGMGGMTLGDSMAEKRLPDQEALGDFHLYTFPFRTDIAANQSKQLQLLQADAVTFSRRFEYRHHTQLEPYRPPQRERVQAFVIFENDEANQLGVPLPAGDIQLYLEDAAGVLQYGGELHIEHTPRNETIELAGTARNIFLEYNWRKYEIAAGNVEEWEVEVPIENQSTRAETVHFYETFHTAWDLLESSHPYEQDDAFTAHFPVTVAPDSTETLRFRVRVTYTP